MTKLRWWVGSVGVLVLVAMAAMLLSRGDTAPARDATTLTTLETRSTAEQTASDSTQLTSSADLTASADGSGDLTSAPDGAATEVGQPGDQTTATSDAQAVLPVESTGGGSTTASNPVAKQPAVKSGPVNGLRLRIPSLGVDAVVTELGTNAAGQLDVPRDAYSVGWYSISTRPGENGNALLGGHLNWAGLRGVFDRLDELSDGDLIYLVEDGQEMVFEVSRSRSVPADASLQEVLQAPAGGSTLTLFTCDGTFDCGAGEYDHRLVVNAQRVASEAG